MKYLEIKNNKGYYRKGEEMLEIDKICKNDLLAILDHAQEKDFEMDEYEEGILQNKAHQIIYQNIYVKLNGFLDDKEKFNKEVDSLYSEAIGEYGADVESEIVDEADIESKTDDPEEEINPDDIPF